MPAEEHPLGVPAGEGPPSDSERGSGPANHADLVASYYDSHVPQEWERLDRHRTEYAVTRRAMEAHLPPPPAAVLDCGGGPGRYALWLAQQGYAVTLFDLSTGNLAFAQELAAQTGVPLAGIQQGTALDLSRFPESCFDAVLLMGPLYHLVSKEQRAEALRQARRVLKPGGVLLVTFISRYAAHRDYAARIPEMIVPEWEAAESLLRQGYVLPRPGEDSGFPGYFAHPNEVQPLLWASGLEVETVLAVEGVIPAEEDLINSLQGLAWERWVEVNYRVAHDPSLQGAVDHLLAVAHRPAWSSVLAHIARKLEAEGLKYNVVGGTCAALHGVPLKVKDIDIEMDAGSAVRFGELFGAQCFHPVALSEDEYYRSHFGRFDFNGVIVEVCGELYRREGAAWIPTFTRTSHRLPVEDVTVSTAWLEEETLAYLRRGRLDRAALCLPYCDAGKMKEVLGQGGM